MKLPPLIFFGKEKEEPTNFLPQQMPVGHVVKDDDGEYFDEDPTFGLGSQPDARSDVKWNPIAPLAPGEGGVVFSEEKLVAVVRDFTERAQTEKLRKEQQSK